MGLYLDNGKSLDPPGLGGSKALVRQLCCHERQQMQIGDKVTWESQAAGSTTTKTGEIVVIVPAGKTPHEAMTTAQRRQKLPKRYDGWPRDHESYIVKVKIGKTDKAMPVLYWPRVKGLQMA